MNFWKWNDMAGLSSCITLFGWRFLLQHAQISGLEFREVKLITEKLPTTRLLSGRYPRFPGCRSNDTTVIRFCSFHHTRLGQ